MRRLAAAVLCAAAALAAAVPNPESHFSHPMGADRKVLDWGQVVSYFRALESGSDRVHVAELGKSTEGRPFIAVTIAAPETLEHLDRYAWIQRRLADPRLTGEAEAERLAGEGKAVVLITCSIHATELASTQTAIEFVYRLVTEDTPRHRAILYNTIFLLVPSLNPDGLDLVAQWYRKTLGTPYEGTAPPRLYQKYTGHDNNRDWYFFTQAETRFTVARLHNAWHPQIVYDMHQQGPYASRIFVPPWMDPIEPNIDALLVQECNLIGMGVALDLTAAGKTGVVVNAVYDFWSPARHYQSYHGGLRILTESASARLASPVTVRSDQIEAVAPGYAPRERSWNYLEPWRGGEWRLRDIVDYQSIAMESVLYQAALRREDLLRNFYRIGRRAVERRSPWGFVISRRQADPGASEKLLQTLAFGAVEIEQAAGGFAAGGKSYPAGSYVIRMQQPYSSFAKTLLERQDYPELRQYPGGPPRRPYDVTAHTLPLLMGVASAALEVAPDVPLARTGEFRFEGRAGLPASDSYSWLAVNRAWSADGAVWRDPASGDFHLERGAFRKLIRPRIGVYRGWMPAIDEGWTRWVLEQFGFAYESVSNLDVLAGGLRRRFDAIVVPDQPAPSIENGYRAGSMPEEYTGGLGQKGGEALKRFAAAGGTLIFLNRSARYAVERLGLSVKNVVQGVSERDFYAPGSLLNVVLEGRGALTYGMPASFAVWSEGSPAWEVPKGSPAQVVARYPRSRVLASGWLLGERYLAGRAALIDYPLGTGHVVLFGMRPQYRGQSWQTFKLLFNALLLSQRQCATTR